MPDEVRSSLDEGGLPAELAALLESFEESPCLCGRTFVRRRGSAHLSCEECTKTEASKARVEKEATAIRSQLREVLEKRLQLCGLTPRELLATAMEIPRPIAVLLDGDQMPGPAAKEMVTGRVPRYGFGLSGTAGGGKTMALALLVRQLYHERVRANLDKLGAAAIASDWLLWCAWPETTNRFRVLSMQDGGLEEVQDMVDAMAKAEVLVLDDLGAERSRGADDWATSQLDVLLDARFNNLRPTWYTTNLGPKDFLARYGPRIYSRLCGENPLVEVPPGPDLRRVVR